MRCSCQFRRRGRRRAHLRLIDQGFERGVDLALGPSLQDVWSSTLFARAASRRSRIMAPLSALFGFTRRASSLDCGTSSHRVATPKKTIGIVLTAISRKGISFQQPVIPESGVYSITHDPVHAEVPHRPRRPFAGPSRRALTGLFRVHRGAAARPSSAGRAASGRCAGPVGASAAHAGARLMH
jgi:hypothetical protein